MKFGTKQDLIKSITGFLKQRERAYRMLNKSRESSTCKMILGRFQSINKWDYWRHCLEVRNSEKLLVSVLPSPKGGHARERENLLQLIEHCKKVAKIPSHIYRQRYGGHLVAIN